MFGSIKNLKCLIVGIVLFGLIGIGVYFYYQRNSANKEYFENPKIAVIPFTNLSPNSETDYLSLAFSDEIAKDLNLTSTNFQVTKVKPLQPNEDLKELLTTYHNKKNIDLALLGTYLISTNEIVISSKLVNAQNFHTVYEKTFTVANKDISLIPRQISGAILSHLRLSVSSESYNYLKPQQIDENVYRDYLKVYNLTDQNRLPEAIEILEKVIQREPKFYYAWTMLSKHYEALAGKALDSNTNYFEKAIEAANKAKLINPNNPDAGILLANIYAEQGKLEEALKEYNNLPANDLEPAARLRLGAYICRYGGLLDESVNLSQSSKKILPKTLIFQPELYYQGNYEEFKKSITPVFDEPSWHSFTLGMVAIYQNDLAMIRKYFQDDIAYEGDSIFGKISQALLLHLDGKTAEGLKILYEQENNINKNKYFDGEILFCLVIAFAYLDDKEGAIRTFKKTVDNGFFCYPYFLRDPIVGKFKSDERFQQILETARQKHLKFKEIYYAENPLKLY